MGLQSEDVQRLGITKWRCPKQRYYTNCCVHCYGYSIERTEQNYKYIEKVVNRNELEKKAQKEFIDKYSKLLSEIDDIKNKIRDEASEIENVQRKGKNELKRKLYSIASSIEKSKNDLEKELNDIVSTDRIENEKLYEVTQLLNSLMGIAVLPYEMHKEFFKYTDDEMHSEENRGKNLTQIQNSVKKEDEYRALKENIMRLYRKGKWVSTYGQDFNNGTINEDRIVFGFLSHIRNATCHSGDNAISILPLDDGKVISEVIFYDKCKDKNDTLKGEFAMELTIEELKEIIDAISKFYRNSKIGSIDKTTQIEKAEQRAKELLGKANQGL